LVDIPWDDVRLFLAIAEAGSLSAAARRLRLGQPTVSRRLAALEYHLGASLFDRSVGGAVLTTAGERLLQPARRMAEWAGEVGRVAEAPGQAPRGLVRVTAAPFPCHDFLAPFAGWLAVEEPGLRLEVLSAIEYLDLARGEADLALRPRPPARDDLSLVGEYVIDNAVYVSPALLARLGRPRSLTDLPWVAWTARFDDVPPNPQLAELMPGYTPAFTTDNFLVLVAAAEAGLGAVVLARPRHQLMRRRELVPLPIDLGPHATTTFYLVCARSALDIPRVRRVAQLLDQELRRAARPAARPAARRGSDNTRPTRRGPRRASRRH
jgi:DNA-binding transcriptional LysR family regulator